MQYKWVVLTNTTIGVLMAMMNSTVLIIALPAIFRGIGLNPLLPSSFAYLLWLLMGYGVVAASLVVNFGRMSDMYGRARLYRLGFAIFTAGSVLLSATPGSGTLAASLMIAFRAVQAVGASMIMANGTALIADAFPVNERGRAMGINQVAGIAGSLVGLLAGGVLATYYWRYVFLISVPFGVLGTVWAYARLREVVAPEVGRRVDVPGNLLSAGGLVLILMGLTYALMPYGGSPLGWGNPLVIALLAAGAAMLASFPIVESRVPDPMMDMGLFRIRMFSAGVFAAFLASLAYGGLMLMLTVLLQGIWLPLHGVPYEETPLWAGIYLVPMMLGFMVMGPLSGALSDRYGARGLATLGMAIFAASFVAMTLLPYDFQYAALAAAIFAAGLGNGMFTSPNTASIISSVPPNRRGIASGMRSVMTLMASTASMAIYFTLLFSAMASQLPPALYSALVSSGMPQWLAREAASMPPEAAVFAAFLGYNPMGTLFSMLPRSDVQAIIASDPSGYEAVLSTYWFPRVIAPAFMSALRAAFYASAAMAAAAAVASLLRGRAEYLRPGPERGA
ncbi:MAG: MFS transporter [Conexivisphaera sp.]